jgi:hypothetical protein
MMLADERSEQEMRIAILGWGSLIWNPRNLRFVGEWQPNGPVLPIEFSRKSGNGRLTLVIDTTKGKKLTTRFALSSFMSLPQAIENLRAREETLTQNIGYINLRDNTYSSRTEQFRVIRKWAKQQNFAAVIWTDLSPSFPDKSFTVNRAVKYLKSLNFQTSTVAREYINRAPTEIMTPLRLRLIEDGWLNEESK